MRFGGMASPAMQKSSIFSSPFRRAFGLVRGQGSDLVAPFLASRPIRASPIPACFLSTLSHLPKFMLTVPFCSLSTLVPPVRNGSLTPASLSFLRRFFHACALLFTLLLRLLAIVIFFGS